MRALLQAAVFVCYAVAAVALAVLVLVGWALGELYRLKGWPEDEPEFSNCWAAAVPAWLKAGTADSYLVVRRSRYAYVPHAMFAEAIDETQVREYKPHAPQRGLAGLVGSFWFKGRLRRGKGEERNELPHA